MASKAKAIVVAIVEAPEPRELCAFLGLAKIHSTLAQPLNELLQKGVGGHGVQSVRGRSEP